jgi:putative aminopeptidase FrvX
VDKLLIDTGYDKETLSKLVSVGTPIGFAPKYTRLGEKMLAGKGFDNKACAACAISAILGTSREELAGDVYLLLSAHEETDRLGGVVCGLAFALEMPLILILVGIVYICETVSVILQVGYFKLTHGKRLFKMSPIHHHFEMCGWKEVKICLVFTAITVVMCILAWFGIAGLVG